MSEAITRIDLLRGKFLRKIAVVRPPWARAEAAFTDTCRRRGDCLAACPEKIITSGRGGFPVVDFGRGECTFCGDCVKACRSGALVPPASEDIRPWNLGAVIGPACLALNGVLCRLCGASCESAAISFRLVVGGGAVARIDTAACTGCGACVTSCPSHAIAIREVTP